MIKWKDLEEIVNNSEDSEFSDDSDMPLKI